MNRPTIDQLRRDIGQVALRIDHGYDDSASTSLVMIMAQTLVNISESIDDIAAASRRATLADIHAAIDRGEKT